MSDIVRELSEIQKIDLELDVIEREKDRCRLEIEDSKSEGGEITDKIALLTEELTSIEAGNTELNEKVRLNKDTITKDQERLGEIKNDKQFKAVTKEISNAEKSIKLLEMEGAALSERINEKREEVSALEAKGTEKDDAAEALAKKLEENNDEWAKEVEAKAKEREALTSKIPARTLKKYDTIRARRAGIGIVTVEKETCQGCFIQIPPQVYILLRRGNEELMNCPHCHRFLYFDGESVKASSPEAAVADESVTEAQPAPADEA